VRLFQEKTMSKSMSFHVPSGLLTAGIHSYSDEAHARKCAFHRDGRRFLKGLAAELGLARGSFEVRSNLGGIAVSGEVTLHSDTLYVQLSESCLRPHVSILYRRCNGRRDYCGQTNHFVAVRDLAADDWRLKALVTELRALDGRDDVQRLAA